MDDWQPSTFLPDPPTPEHAQAWLPSTFVPDSSNVGKPQVNSMGNNNPQPSVNGQQPQQQPGFLEGVKRGFLERGVGAAKLASAAGYNPLGPSTPQQLDQYGKQLESEGKDTGITGTAGEMAGDPLSYFPLGGTELKGAKALMQTGAKFGALSGASSLLSPNENGDLENRAWDAARSATFGAPLGVLGAKGTELAGKGLQGIANKTGLSDLATKAAEKLSGIVSKGSDLYESAKNYGFGSSSNSPEDIYDNLVNSHNSNIDKVASQISQKPLNPLEANASISERYYGDQQESSDLYNGARFNGEGKTVVANGLQNKLSNAINELGGKQFRSASEDAALSSLQDIQSNLGRAPRSFQANVETGTTQPTTSWAQARGNKPTTTTVQPLDEIGFNDLLDLKQALNEGYNSGAFSTKGSRKVGQFYGQVKDWLAQAGEQDRDPVSGASPFGDALENADRNYERNIAKTYFDPTLKKFWNPDDYHEYLRTKGFTQDTASDSLMNRAGKTLDNINSPADLNSVASAVHPQIADSVRAAKYKQLMEDAGMDADKINANDELAKYALGPSNLDAHQNIKDFTQMLNDRGIGDNMSFFDNANNSRVGYGMQAGLNALAGRKIYALKDVYRALGPKKASASQKRLTDFMGDVNSGAPGRDVLDPYIDYAAGLAGKQSALRTGYSTGGRVYDHQEWLTLVRKHGKATGVGLKDRLRPDKIEVIEKAASKP